MKHKIIENPEGSQNQNLKIYFFGHRCPRKFQFCPTEGSNSCNFGQNWTTRLDLTRLPTKPEDLKVKLDSESNVALVSGKSEIFSEFEEIKVQSTHNWSKEIRIPAFIDKKTLNVKMNKNELIVTGTTKSVIN